ncbi:head completion/stabilization protein [Methylobacter sp. G7]|uniref:head completion/stabilization protein n=1 Tax=Methylobacter sp. G7 TaxID=3230117 RepID=UPI003D802C69
MSLTGNPTLTSASAITNDGFWPNLSIADLLNNYRVPAEYADSVISTGLVMAIVRVNDVLYPVKEAVVSMGFNVFAAYVAAHHPQAVNSVNMLELNYHNAVHTRAKAGLLQQFNSMNRKPNAENAAKESESTEQYFLDESQLSIKALFDAVLPDAVVFGSANTYASLL